MVGKQGFGFLFWRPKLLYCKPNCRLNWVVRYSKWAANKYMHRSLTASPSLESFLVYIAPFPLYYSLIYLSNPVMLALVLHLCLNQILRLQFVFETRIRFPFVVMFVYSKMSWVCCYYQKFWFKSLVYNAFMVAKTSGRRTFQDIGICRSHFPSFVLQRDLFAFISGTTLLLGFCLGVVWSRPSM